MPLIQDGEFLEDEAAEPDTPEESLDALPEFDPRHKDAFSGLLFLGSLKRDFDLGGHKFIIKTLNTDEILAVGLSVKKYEDSPSKLKAYATALVAACIVNVDGHPLETPYREESVEENLRFRIGKVALWSPFIIDMIYSEYLLLERQVGEVFDAMGKASG